MNAAASSHPRTRLNELIHQPIRFSMMAALTKADELEFRFLRDTLGVSDSVLSRHASALEVAGYITIRKGHVGKWPRTWHALTGSGRAALDDHVAALRELVG
ncbi:transcriptional regulator [soil metagenome]